MGTYFRVPKRLYNYQTKYFLNFYYVFPINSMLHDISSTSILMPLPWKERFRNQDIKSWTYIYTAWSRILNGILHGSLLCKIFFHGLLFCTLFPMLLFTLHCTGQYSVNYSVKYHLKFGLWGRLLNVFTLLKYALHCILIGNCPIRVQWRAYFNSVKTFKSRPL